MAEFTHTSNFSGDIFTWTFISTLIKEFLHREEERNYLIKINLSLRKDKLLHYLLPRNLELKKYSFQRPEQPDLSLWLVQVGEGVELCSENGHEKS